MAVTAKIAEAPLKDDSTVRAAALLRATIEQKGIETIISTHKDWFRNWADGETKEEIVEGLGKVQVKKPSEGGTATSLVLDTKKYEALDAETKRKLIKAGVITSKTVVKAPSLAAVVVTLNV